MMFQSLLVPFLLAANGVDAFVPVAFPATRSIHNSMVGRQLQAAQQTPDVSAAIEEALKVTAAFGIDSKDAQVAWDIVEELSASDNSAASKAGLDVECELEENGDMSKSCADYQRFMEEIEVVRGVIAKSKEGKPKPTIVETLKSIKISKPVSSQSNSSPQLTAALEAAKAATAEHGVTSKEARLAWEEYEEIASSGLDNAIGVRLDEECHIEAGQEACEAIEALDQILPILQAIASPNK